MTRNTPPQSGARQPGPSEPVTMRRAADRAIAQSLAVRSVGDGLALIGRVSRSRDTLLPLYRPGAMAFSRFDPKEEVCPVHPIVLRPGFQPLVVLCLALCLLPPATGRRSALAQEGPETEKLRALALELVNKSRAENKLPPLQIGKEVNAAAKAHAADMLRRNFYDHVTPEGKTIQDRFIKAGGSRWQLAAENIARCTGCELGVKTVEEFQRGWMNSKGHRENILRRGIIQFGFSMVTQPGKPLYAVQTFSGPGVSNGSAGNEAAKPLSEKEVVAKALEVLNAERKKAGRPAFVESAGLTKAVRSLLPAKKLDEFNLSQIGNVMDKLPESERKAWQSLTTLAAACGGCGAEPTAADVRGFVQQWLSSPGNKTMMLNAASTHLGFALAASGQGKKVALAVIGKKQPKQGSN
jgi:uncharacterized protein YkwD